MALKYSTINHDFRKHHELSCNEYVLCDMIYFLSMHPRSKLLGWCYMSRRRMADEMGVSKVAVMGMISRAEEKGFIIKDERTRYLKTTDQWNECYGIPDLDDSEPVKKVDQVVKKVYRGGKESLPVIGKESLPNNIYSNNNIDIKQAFSEKSLEEVQEEKHLNIFRSLYTSEKWITDLSIKWKRTPKEVQGHLEAFCKDLILKGDFKTKDKDARSHFINWTEKGNEVKKSSKGDTFTGF